MHHRLAAKTSNASHKVVFEPFAWWHSGCNWNVNTNRMDGWKSGWVDGKTSESNNSNKNTRAKLNRSTPSRWLEVKIIVWVTAAKSESAVNNDKQQSRTNTTVAALNCWLCIFYWRQNIYLHLFHCMQISQSLSFFIPTGTWIEKGSQKSTTQSRVCI